MDKSALFNMLYEEVYIVGVDTAVTPSGELVVCSSYEQLLSHLRTKNISICSDLRVIHGVLTSAKSIPRDLRNQQAFIVVMDQENHSHGVILDSESDDDYKELAYEVRSLLKGNESANFLYDIDQMFILYGYELSIVMSVDEDDIETDDTIETCKSIADIAEKLDKLGED
ncbi:MAG: hypothetical protein E3J47_05860 [Candidatus Stahlbacteria bacterium]|nr:MAG: hypothetical protein E3J47_05860 [Candidatus Stahlbacteria bacterium]